MVLIYSFGANGAAGGWGVRVVLPPFHTCPSRGSLRISDVNLAVELWLVEKCVFSTRLCCTLGFPSGRCRLQLSTTEHGRPAASPSLPMLAVPALLCGSFRVRGPHDDL
jgi:hypothetical protein